MVSEQILFYHLLAKVIMIKRHFKQNFTANFSNPIFRWKKKELRKFDVRRERKR